MFDREFMTEQLQKDIVKARLNDVLNVYGADVDMVLLMRIMVDATDGELTAGDIAAIYCYRCQLAKAASNG